MYELELGRSNTKPIKNEPNELMQTSSSLIASSSPLYKQEIKSESLQENNIIANNNIQNNQLASGTTSGTSLNTASSTSYASK